MASPLAEKGSVEVCIRVQQERETEREECKKDTNFNLLVTRHVFGVKSLVKLRKNEQREQEMARSVHVHDMGATASKDNWKTLLDPGSQSMLQLTDLPQIYERIWLSSRLLAGPVGKRHDKAVCR